MDKVGVALLKVVFQSTMHMDIDILDFADRGDTLDEVA